MSSSKLDVEVRAPVQGWPDGIPWSMHLRAYDTYSKKWSPQPAMIDLEGRNCRGGFSTGELDMFIPGWRDELSELTALKKRIADLEAALRPFSERCADTFPDDADNSGITVKVKYLRAAALALTGGGQT